VVLDVPLASSDGEGQAWLHAHTEVLSRDTDEEGGAHFHIRVLPEQCDRVLRRFPGSEAVENLSLRHI
jgi:GTP-binding protein HflX